MRRIQVGVIGLGTVGTGVVKLLMKNGSHISRMLGVSLELAMVAEKDVSKHAKVDLPHSMFTTNAMDIIKNPDINIVVEVIGGVETAKELILAALNTGKSVVTANKDLLAVHGRELFETAAQCGTDLYFEASVGGGIPIIRPLKECLAGNRIDEVVGIVNGTTNYILTKMSHEGVDFREVLTQAQMLGYAEADPTSDVEGYDAARKMAILASIAFQTRVTFQDVYVEGITKITAQDITYAKELGYTVKLLGIARESRSGIEIRVHPVMLPQTHPLAAVNDVFNAIFVRGDAVGETMFYGRGAGEMPTASAIVGDIIAVARDLIHHDTGRIPCTCFEHKRIKPIGEVETRFFLRLLVKDRPGVLASIASVFGNQEVSLASVIQKRCIDDMAEIVLVTHKVLEQNFRDALCILEGLSAVAEVSNVIRVEGGPQ